LPFLPGFGWLASTYLIFSLLALHFLHTSDTDIALFFKDLLILNGCGGFFFHLTR
jgi:hypothetical protein